MITLGEVKEKLKDFDTYSVRKGIFTVRKEFYYPHGRHIDYFELKIKEAFPDAKIVDSAEIWKSFRGGASTADSSHWFVKFTFEN